MARRAAMAAMARRPQAPRPGQRQMNGTHATAAPANGSALQRPGKGDQVAAAAVGDAADGKPGITAASGNHAAPAVPNGNVAGGSVRAEPHMNGTSGRPVEQAGVSSGSRSQVAGQLHKHVRQQLQAAPFPDQHRGMSHDPPADKLGGQNASSQLRFSGIAANGAAVKQADPTSTAAAHENGHGKPRVLVVEPPRATGHVSPAGGGSHHQRRQQQPIMQFGTFTDDRPVKSGPAAPPQPVNNHAGHAFNQSVAAALGLAVAGPSAAAPPAMANGPASGGKS